MARPVSVASKRRGRTHPFGRSPLAAVRRPGVCGATSGGVRIETDWRRHAPTAPTWCSRTRYSLRGGSCLQGQMDRPDAPRRNPRASARRGCQVPILTCLSHRVTVLVSDVIESWIPVKRAQTTLCSNLVDALMCCIDYGCFVDIVGLCISI